MTVSEFDNLVFTFQSCRLRSYRNQYSYFKIKTLIRAANCRHFC